MHARRHTLFGFLRGTSIRDAVRLRGGRLALGALALAVVTVGCAADAAVDAADTEGIAEDAEAADTADTADDADTANGGDTEDATDTGAAADTEAPVDDAEADDDAGTTDRVDRYDEAPEPTIDIDADYRILVETSLGTIEADLFASDAPVTVNSFVFLAREGYFDGLTFHRVIPGFVAQGGDPRGDGTGGPGYAFEDELGVAEREGYPLGTLAMANSGPNTNGSQFFFTVDDVDLPPLYSVFGQVTSGLEVLEAIAAQPTGPGDRPVDDVRIITVEVDGP
jgi:cyclophilin family peptidyl-prolyl cis-trans isomerase